MKRNALVSGLVALLLVSAAEASQPSAEAEHEVRTALKGFLTAFEHGDLEAMEAAFADDAVTFPRAIMSTSPPAEIRTEDYKRVVGLDPQMRELIARWRASGDPPPYIRLDPKDLEIRVFSEAALATFHLERDGSLSRRTFVLAKRAGAWKVVHLHASNVVGSD